MKKTNLWMGILAITLVFGMTFAGCGPDPADPDGDKTLSGEVTISPNGCNVGEELTADYSGSETVSYQWNKGDTAVSGATTRTFSPTSDGTYTVTVSAKGYKSKTSASVKVTDNPGLQGNVTVSPQAGTIGTELTATFTGDTAVTYQWYRNDTAIPGATTTKYTPTEEGTYIVSVSAEGFATRNSRPVVITSVARVVDIDVIVGVTDPVVGKTPVTSVTENIQYSGTIAWSGSPAVFGASTEYTATITLTAKSGFTLTGVPANFFSVPKATTVSNPENSGVITAVFPAYMPMVRVTGGTFQMGKHLGSAAGADVTPMRMVTLSEFFMGKYEVTEALYDLVTTGNISENNLPRAQVSWYLAIVFCNKLSMLEGLSPAYRLNGKTDPAEWGDPPAENAAAAIVNVHPWNAMEIVSGSTGYRLPTEAQWEYAAKGGDQTATDWKGYTYSGSDTLTDVGWVAQGGTDSRKEVGGKAPNKLGLYDMSGNVMEWCWDWYGPYPNIDQTDPLGPPAGVEITRTRRGGNWNSAANAAEPRAEGRSHRIMSNSGTAVGFRIVRPATAVVIPPTFLETVNVPGGTFQMGKNLGTGGGTDVTPLHTVTLTGFNMGKYEVTREQYLAVMGNDPSGSAPNAPADGETNMRRPVENVHWWDAIVFCNKLSMREGLTPVYSIDGKTDPAEWGTIPGTSNPGADSSWHKVVIVTPVAPSTIHPNGYRLPTEAQWEYAAKGGNPTAEGWIGYTWSGSDTLAEVAWYNNAGGKTREVGKLKPNKLGLYDMSGNVMEWCWDYNGAYTDADQTDPLGPTAAPTDFRRTRRGGNWNSANTAVELRSEGRSDREPWTRGVAVGFRVARP